MNVILEVAKPIGSSDLYEIPFNHFLFFGSVIRARNGFALCSAQARKAFALLYVCQKVDRLRYTRF